MTEPRRIAMVVGQLGVGGTERQVFALSTYLARTGFAVCVVSTSPSVHPYAERIREQGIPVHVLGRRRQRAGELGRHLGAHRSELVHSFGDPALGWVVLANARLGLPHVHSVRGEAHGPVRRALRWLGLRQADLVTVNAHCLGRALGHGAVTFTPNGVDPSRFDPSPPPRDGRYKLLYVGRRHPDKDLPTLVSAVRHLARGRVTPRLELALVGRGLGAVAHALARLGHLDVQEVGEDPDVERWFAWCDVLIHCSRREGMPNVVLEAMAAARPVVATRAGGTAEAVVDRVTGRLVEVADPGALSRALAELAADPLLRERLGAEGRARACSCYSLDRAGAALERCYRELVPTRDSSAAESCRRRSKSST